MKHHVLFASLLLLACPAEEQPKLDGGFYVDPIDAGPPPIVYTQFTARVNGWPSGAPVRGVALLDRALYAASEYGVYSLQTSATTWRPESVPLPAGELPSSLQRIGDTLVLTTASDTSGGVWTKTLDTPWARVASSPAAPTWKLLQKSADYLLITTGGLYVASDFEGVWTQRSDAGVFAEPVRLFAAAPAQQKMFAAEGRLWESLDQGATWRTLDAGTGAVTGLAANGAVVLVATDHGAQLRSSNYGNTFYPQATGLEAGVSFYLARGDRFWAGNGDGLFASDDEGVTFVRDGTGLPSETPVTALFFAGSYVVADTVDGPYITQRP